jgi:hypothetical protein
LTRTVEARPLQDRPALDSPRRSARSNGFIAPDNDPTAVRNSVKAIAERFKAADADTVHPTPRTYGPAPKADGNPSAYLFTCDEAKKGLVLQNG